MIGVVGAIVARRCAGQRDQARLPSAQSDIHKTLIPFLAAQLCHVFIASLHVSIKQNSW
jgi:hypothetical protein